MASGKNVDEGWEHIFSEQRSLFDSSSASELENNEQRQQDGLQRTPVQQDRDSIHIGLDARISSTRSSSAATFHSASSFGQARVAENDGESSHELDTFASIRPEATTMAQASLGNPSSSLATNSTLVNVRRAEADRQPFIENQASYTPNTTVTAVPPVSSRARDRGFSLRRSILARNIHGQQTNSRSANSSAVSTRQDIGQSTKSIKFSVNNKQHASTRDDDFEPTPNPPGEPSLPNYEEWWRASKASRSRFLSRFRDLVESVRKKILRYQELPPSKDGRHVVLDSEREKPLHDDRRDHEYINNLIISCRYTLYNFLPRQLFAQFSKLANFYFLCVSILQMIPGLSTTGTFTTLVPLLFFVAISMAKEAYDDFRRYKLDKAENNRTTTILRAFQNVICNLRDEDVNTSKKDEPQIWTDTRWQDIRVGDVVKLGRDEAVPADIIILQASSTDNVAFIETMALDGETNLKSKRAPPIMEQHHKSIHDIINRNVHFVGEDPNLDLYRFEGKVSIGDQTMPLTNNEIIYRGSTVRNTHQVIGLVLYTGEECKIRMNATKNPRIKAPALQAMVNKVVIILVIFVIALAIFNTVAYQIWQEQVEEDAWYLTNASVAFFPILASFIILFNTMIPLSLYVSLEIVKLCQMFLLNDVDMYDEDSNTPMEARTSTINEELGQVNYVFSDKTGTLTNNTMKFRNLSTAGVSWSHDRDVQDDANKSAISGHSVERDHAKGKKPLSRKTSTSYTTAATKRSDGWPITHAPMARKGSVVSNQNLLAHRNSLELRPGTTELIRYLQRHPHSPFSRKVRFFLLSIALCHTCTPEQGADGATEYQATSPDEYALVRAAEELGYMVIERNNSSITIRAIISADDGSYTTEVYDVLDVLEFSSTRKRMSIIIRMPNGQVCIFCKGADSTISRLLRLAGLAVSKSVEVERSANDRRSLEAQEVVRRKSEAQSRKNSMTRKSVSIHRPSLGGAHLPSKNAKRLQPIQDDVDGWSRKQEAGILSSQLNNEADSDSHSASARYNGLESPPTSPDTKKPFEDDERGEIVEEILFQDEATIFERSFQHINDFASEGLRTLMYGYRYLEKDEYTHWKKLYSDASTSLVDRQDLIEKAAAIVEKDLEFGGITAIEDKLQDGVPEAIDKLQRASIKLWMLTGDKRETAINIGHSCRLIKDYSSMTILDDELGDVSQRIAAATLQLNSETVAHSVVVIDGHTLGQITASEPLYKLFLSLSVLVDTVICCRASPAQKASLVASIRHKVKGSVTLAIGDGANDIAMIQDAHVGIGITGKEGLQAARTSDYSIAQFRFLTKLLLVHGRWNYLRTCKYTLATLWKELFFYLTQALYQRYAGYTGTSLFENWSLSLFNTLFTSLPVIFMGVFEQDLPASTLLAVPELYHSLGHNNGGFNIKRYLAWDAMAASQAVVVFFIMLGLYGQAFLVSDNGIFAMGDLVFTACVIVIATKVQFWDIYNRTYTCIIAMFLSIGGWFLWNIILASTYSKNVIYNVKDGLFDRFGKNPLWWLTLILVVTACWALEAGFKALKVAFAPTEADLFRELGKDPAIRKRFEEAAKVGLLAGASYNDLDDYSSEDGRQAVRTEEEEKQRENEVEDLLRRRRHSRVVSGTSHELELERIETGTELRHRHRSESAASPSQGHKMSFARTEREIEVENDDLALEGKEKEKPRRRSTDVPSLLKKGFGSIRRSLDVI